MYMTYIRICTTHSHTLTLDTDAYSYSVKSSQVLGSTFSNVCMSRLTFVYERMCMEVEFSGMLSFQHHAHESCACDMCVGA